MLVLCMYVSIHSASPGQRQQTVCPFYPFVCLASFPVVSLVGPELILEHLLQFSSIALLRTRTRAIPSAIGINHNTDEEVLISPLKTLDKSPTQEFLSFL